MVQGSGVKSALGQGEREQGRRLKAVLFLCVANSARSQMAEAIARRLAPPGVAVFSAGSAPSSVNPLAVRVLAEVGLDASGQHSKGLDAIPLDAIDTVVTLCAEEVCPVFPGKVERVHWPLTDPAAAEGTEAQRLEAFRGTRDELQRRLASLFSS
jgi:arsenate reductase